MRSEEEHKELASFHIMLQRQNANAKLSIFCTIKIAKLLEIKYTICNVRVFKSLQCIQHQEYCAGMKT